MTRFIIFCVIVISTYGIIVYSSMKTRSVFALLSVQNGNTSLDMIPFYASQFGLYLHGERLLSLCTRWTFAKMYGLTWLQVFLLEQGFRISTDALIRFLVEFNELLETEDGYCVNEDSFLGDWCSDRCEEVKNQMLDEESRDSLKGAKMAPICLYKAPKVSFDEYIFKQKPVVFLEINLNLANVAVPTDVIREQNND